MIYLNVTVLACVARVTYTSVRVNAIQAEAVGTAFCTNAVIDVELAALPCEPNWTGAVIVCKEV